MENTKIKDLLLKSGIPLEISVVKKLSKLGIQEWGEIEYEKDGKYFTTDICASKDFFLIDKIGLNVKFSIECKYKARNHNWFFMKFSDEFEWNVRSDVRNVIFDDFLRYILPELGYKPKKMLFNKPHISGRDFRVENLFEFQLANKAVDIIDNAFDPNIIKEAISQSIYGAIVIHRDGIHYNTDELSELIGKKKEDLNRMQDEEHFIISSLLIPIVVTTAKLFKIKEDVSLEDIEKSEKLDSLFDEVKGITLITSDENFNIFSKNYYNKNPIPVTKEVSDWLKNINEPDLLNYCDISTPGFVYIINYNYIDESLKLVLDKIERLCRVFSTRDIKS